MFLKLFDMFIKTDFLALSHKYQMLTADKSDYAVNIGVLDYTAVVCF